MLNTVSDVKGKKNIVGKPTIELLADRVYDGNYIKNIQGRTMTDIMLEFAVIASQIEEGSFKSISLYREKKVEVKNEHGKPTEMIEMRLRVEPKRTYNKRK